MTEIRDYRNKLERLKGQKEQLLENIEDTQRSLNKTRRDIKNTEDALLIVQAVAKQTQEKLSYHISELVSLALSSVYDNPYEFKLKFVTRRNKTEADVLFVRDRNEYIPGKSTGYGPLELAAFALRVALWNIIRPRVRNVMILDEPFSSVDVRAQEKISDFLKVVSKKLNIQIIMVSHSNRIIKSSDKIYETKLIDGITELVEK